MVKRRICGKGSDEITNDAKKQPLQPETVVEPRRNNNDREIVVRVEQPQKSKTSTAIKASLGTLGAVAGLAGVAYAGKKAYDVYNKFAKPIKKAKSRDKHVKETRKERNDLHKAAVKQSAGDSRKIVPLYHKSLKENKLKRADSSKSGSQSLLNALWTAGSTVSQKGLSGLKKAWKGGSRHRNSIRSGPDPILAFLLKRSRK